MAKQPPRGAPWSRDREADLIRRARTGDERAVRSLYDRYSPRVYAVARRIAGDDDLAKDCAQEAWIRAIRALPSFRQEARFSTWMHQVTRNTTLQLLRRERPRREREAALTENISTGPARGDSLLARRLEEAVESLPDGMRTVLVMHDVEGWTHEQIADALGVTAGTSKSQLHKARAKLRPMLKGLRSDRGFETNAGEKMAWGV